MTVDFPINLEASILFIGSDAGEAVPSLVDQSGASDPVVRAAESLAAVVRAGNASGITRGGRSGNG